MSGSDDRAAAAAESSARLEKLKDRVERASTLIGELRETNHTLSAELALLRNRLASAEEQAAEAASLAAAASAEAEAEAEDEDEDEDHEARAAMAEELTVLRSERDAIRKKLEGLLARIEKLEA